MIAAAATGPASPFYRGTQSRALPIAQRLFSRWWSHPFQGLMAVASIPFGRMHLQMRSPEPAPTAISKPLALFTDTVIVVTADTDNAQLGHGLSPVDFPGLSVRGFHDCGLGGGEPPGAPPAQLLSSTWRGFLHAVIVRFQPGLFIFLFGFFIAFRQGEVNYLAINL